MKNNETKQKVMNAASRLFFSKGYHGTSVRDIAKRASVNVSLINYYFNSKQGLLESSVIHYYEAYLKEIEQSFEQTQDLLAAEQLKNLIEVIIQYKQDYHQFTCFIHRELTIDSVFVREMAVTYLAKENFILRKTFDDALQGTSHDELDKDYLFLQFKGLLITPYMTPNEWKDKVIWDQSHELFIKKYTQSIHKWLDYALERPYEKSPTPYL